MAPSTRAARSGIGRSDVVVRFEPVIARAGPERSGVASPVPIPAPRGTADVAIGTAAPAGPRENRTHPDLGSGGRDADRTRVDRGDARTEPVAPRIAPEPVGGAEGEHLAIKVGLTTAVDDTTAVNFAVTNNRKHALSLLIIRCNALTAAGRASGQAFDALHNIDVGETVYGQALFLKQTIAPRSSFACRDEGTAE